jgi:hypothetical protein
MQNVIGVAPKRPPPKTATPIQAPRSVVRGTVRGLIENADKRAISGG